MTEIIFLINLASSLFLTGLIWMVQIVHYPFFRFANENRFDEAMKFHRFRISFLVVPVMLAELISSVWLSIYAVEFSELHQAGLFTVLLIWLVTFISQVPRHSNLANGYQPDQISKLVKSNWARTGLWTLKSFITLFILLKMITVV